MIDAGPFRCAVYIESSSPKPVPIVFVLASYLALLWIHFLTYLPVSDDCFSHLDVLVTVSGRDSSLHMTLTHTHLLERPSFTHITQHTITTCSILRVLHTSCTSYVLMPQYFTLIYHLLSYVFWIQVALMDKCMEYFDCCCSR